MSAARPPGVGEPPVQGRRRRRRRFTPFALLVGLVCSVIVTSGVASSYSALTAGITNTVDSAGTGTLVMQETDSSGSATRTCTSSDGSGNVLRCSTFDKYGGGTQLQPGSGSSTGAVRIYNIGALDATTFTLTPGPCTVISNPLGTAGNVCDKLLIIASCNRNGSSRAGLFSLFGSGATLTSVASVSVDLKTSRSCSPPPTTAGGGTWTQFRFSVQLDPAAGTEVQGQVAQQELVWQFTAGT